MLSSARAACRGTRARTGTPGCSRVRPSETLPVPGSSSRRPGLRMVQLKEVRRLRSRSALAFMA
jgi:hypothetical protein